MHVDTLVNYGSLLKSVHNEMATAEKMYVTALQVIFACYLCAPACLCVSRLCKLHGNALRVMLRRPPCVLRRTPSVRCSGISIGGGCRGRGTGGGCT
jgi:hypothetical protein